MIRRQATIHLVLCALLFCGSFAACAQERSEREKLADQLLDMPDSQAESADMEREVADAIARAVFKRLRDDPAWTADDPDWQKNYPDFQSSFQSHARSNEYSKARSELKSALVEKLTEDELRHIVVTLSGPDMAEIRVVMKKLGLDMPSSIRMINVITQPALYTSAERDAIRARLMALKDGEAELKESVVRLGAAMQQVLKAPAFAKYQLIVQATMRGAMTRMQIDADAMKEMQDYIAAWRKRVSAR